MKKILVLLFVYNLSLLYNLSLFCMTNGENIIYACDYGNYSWLQNYGWFTAFLHKRIHTQNKNENKNENNNDKLVELYDYLKKIQEIKAKEFKTQSTLQECIAQSTNFSNLLNVFNFQAPNIIEQKFANKFSKFTPILRNIINFAIKNNFAGLIELLVRKGFLLRNIEEFEYKSIGNKAKYNPLHVLVQTSKDHDDPVNMAQFLVNMGAEPVRCNKYSCLTFEESLNALDKTDYYKYPHEVLDDLLKEDLKENL